MVTPLTVDTASDPRRLESGTEMQFSFFFTKVGISKFDLTTCSKMLT